MCVAEPHRSRLGGGLHPQSAGVHLAIRQQPANIKARMVPSSHYRKIYGSGS